MLSRNVKAAATILGLMAVIWSGAQAGAHPVSIMVESSLTGSSTLVPCHATTVAFERRCIPTGGVASPHRSHCYASSTRLAGRARRHSRCRHLSRGMALSDTLTVGTVGDIMLGSWLIDVIGTYGPAYPYSDVLPILQRADLLSGNLEAPFLADTTGVERAEKTYTFVVPPARAAVLKAGGFDIVTLANNHILDYGVAGLIGTWAALDSIGIRHVGTGRTKDEAHSHTIVEKGGIRVAFLAYNHTFPAQFWATGQRAGTAHASDEGLAREVRRADGEADIVIVAFHWSGELLETPREYQRILARIAIDNGADLVVGHHPHTLQPLEWYRERLIAYSLGNFIFGSYSPVAGGAALIVKFVGDSPVAAELHPLDVNNLRREFRPLPLEPSMWSILESGVLQALADSSAAGHEGIVIDPEGFLLLLPPP